MNKWFDKRLDKKDLRKETLRSINNNNFYNKSKIFRKLSLTNWIILLNFIVYFVLLFFIAIGYDENKINKNLALQANNFFSGYFWTLITSMFTHIWLPHLFFNMISLFFVGNFLEKIIGRKKYIWFYIISGIFAGIIFVSLSYFFGVSELGARIFVSPETPAVGASGAIFGIAGLLSVLTPFMRVYLIAGPLFAIIIQAVISYYNLPGLSIINSILTIYIFFSIFLMFSFNSNLRKISIPIAMPFWVLPIVAIVPLVVIGLFVPLPIGNTAHFGGLIAGLLYGIYLKKKYKRRAQIISKFFRG